MLTVALGYRLKMIFSFLLDVVFGNYCRFIVVPLHVTIVNKMGGYASTFEVKQ